MSDRQSENTFLVQVAAEKANKDLGEIKINKKHLLSTDTGTTILNKYEESERNRDNSFKDTLTGLLNRRGLLEEYKLEELTRLRGGITGKITLIAFDFIGMKKMNSEISPTATDIILKKSADSIKRQIRRTDLACRWGGDEFLVVLFGADEDSAVTTIKDIIDTAPSGVHYNIGYKTVDSGEDAEHIVSGLMSKLDYVKTLGPTDDTGRAVGEGMVVNIDNI